MFTAKSCDKVKDDIIGISTYVPVFAHVQERVVFRSSKLKFSGFLLGGAEVASFTRTYREAVLSFRAPGLSRDSPPETMF